KGGSGGGPFAGLASAFKGLRGGGGGAGGRGGGGGSALDPYMAFFAVALVVAVGYMVWAYSGVNDTREELQVRIEEEVQDSTRRADLIERTNLLMARNDSIAQRVTIIQEIDQ